MYVPAFFREDRLEVLAGFMRDHPLAALITVGESGLEANHVPLLYDPEPPPFGTLRGHLARANLQWLHARPEHGALAVFQGPQAYVSPSWYPSKAEHGRVVPTWNYAVVHARGELAVHEDREWLRGLVTRLTETHEAGFAHPWRVADAPTDYIDGLLNAIVGIELRIHKLEGKWKASQNRGEADRAGVALALAASPEAEAREMAELLAPGEH